ncbi:unnamed protein product [marine sediment metagenome]|uniref:Uncharacterized protein n=1 Tax=marine sediment metagenome TaxID=412755 RepID=X1LBR9_9ZZZZ
MAQLTRKLMQRFKAVSPDGLAEAAKECRDAADRYRACSERLVTAAVNFDDGKFEAGYGLLEAAEIALDKK